MPQVSVIVPCYNAASFLQSCVDGLVRQSLRDIEILLVDDGSTDQSRALAERMAQSDSRIAVLTQPHTGPGAARNRGLDTARAPYIMFVDSDDDVTTDACESLLRRAEETGADMVAGKMQDWSRPAVPSALASSPATAIQALYTGRISMSACAKLYRRSHLQAHEIRFPPAIYIEDRHFLLQCLIGGATLTALERVVYHRHRRPESTMHRIGLKHLTDVTAAYELDVAALERAGLLGACGYHAAWATLVVDVYLARAIHNTGLRDALAAEIDRQEALFLRLSGSRARRWIMAAVARQLRRDLSRGPGFAVTRACLVVAKVATL